MIENKNTWKKIEKIFENQFSKTMNARDLDDSF